MTVSQTQSLPSDQQGKLISTKAKADQHHQLCEVPGRRQAQMENSRWGLLLIEKWEGVSLGE